MTLKLCIFSLKIKLIKDLDFTSIHTKTKYIPYDATIPIKTEKKDGIPQLLKQNMNNTQKSDMLVAAEILLDIIPTSENIGAK